MIAIAAWIAEQERRRISERTIAGLDRVRAAGVKLGPKPIQCNVEEIRRFVEADSLGYLSLGGLREAVADHNHDYCYSCYTGNYPTELVNIQELMSAKDRRT